MSTKRTSDSPGAMPAALGRHADVVQPPPRGGAAFLIDSPAAIFTPEHLSTEARLVGRSMEQFARHEIVPIIDRLDAQEPGLMASLVRQAGKLGLLAAGLPRRYGGLDLPKTTTALLAEKSAVDLSFAITIGVHGGVAALPLLLFGAEAQRDRYLPALASGEMIAAFALSEGNSGSDALAAQTRAWPIDGGYILDGTKLWVTNGGFADLFTVFAQSPEGFTALLVPRDSPGLSVSGEEKKMGLRASSTRRLFLNNVAVPADAVLGEPGRGHKPALYALNAGRFNIGAIALGGAKEALRIATEYALVRRQSGRPIAEFDLVGAKLAEMSIRIHALESMVYRVAGLFDAAPEFHIPHSTFHISEEYAVECALIKFFGTEVLAYTVDECLQIHGGFGYSEEFPAARLYRDARVFRIFEGTNEINRLTVVDQIRRRIDRGRLPALSESPTSTDTPVDRLRSAARFVLTKVLEHEAPQSAIAAAADMTALLFALESMTLRGTAPAIIDAFADHALTVAVVHARTALAALGISTEAAKDVLGPLVDRPLVETIGLRQAIADEVRQCGGYLR